MEHTNEGWDQDAIRKPLDNQPDTITLEKSYSHDDGTTKGRHTTVTRTVRLAPTPLIAKPAQVYHRGRAIGYVG